MNTVQTSPFLGARPLDSQKTAFSVWAPRTQRVDVHLVAPQERFFPLTKKASGYHEGLIEGVAAGRRYRYRLDGEESYPDLASRSQPEGVHGPSEVVSLDFPWTDQAWKGRPLTEYIFYELHVGTFTLAGTFEAILPKLPSLKALGITAIELMPIAQFPGKRNWGYDGVYPFAAHNTYGGLRGLQSLVNACHAEGLAVVLDVVYNHLGPEGNYFHRFGPYFTERYTTPWGAAMNFDQEESDGVRHYFIENARYWLFDCHIDALRLDAVHGIFDARPKTFLETLGEVVHEEAHAKGLQKHLIAESDLNDTRIIRSPQEKGYGLDSQWTDDFHHALHAVLTQETNGYYQDFGNLQHVAKALKEGFVYSGQYSAYRKKQHGNPSSDLGGEKHVVFLQNHDQVGNRMLGERLSQLVSFEALKLAAGLLCFSPYLPLLFMGEEYGEMHPFLYFIDHSDPDLIRAVQEGRANEFQAFRWKGTPPDPAAHDTFVQCYLTPEKDQTDRQRILKAYYQALFALRRHPVLSTCRKDHLEVRVFETEKVLLLKRWHGEDEILALFHLGPAPRTMTLPMPEGRWRCRWDASEVQWGGLGSHVPKVITSGPCTVLLPSYACFLFEKERGMNDHA